MDELQLSEWKLTVMRERVRKLREQREQQLLADKLTRQRIRVLLRAAEKRLKTAHVVENARAELESRDDADMRAISALEAEIRELDAENQSQVRTFLDRLRFATARQHAALERQAELLEQQNHGCVSAVRSLGVEVSGDPHNPMFFSALDK